MLWKWSVFLKIPSTQTGSTDEYDYWLMSVLDWYDIFEHGSAIRCSWFQRDQCNPYQNRKLSCNRKKKTISKWYKNI